MQDILILLGKVAALIFVIFTARAIWIHMRILATLRRLTVQGITSYPGNRNFLIGPALTVHSEFEKRRKLDVLQSEVLWA